MAAINTQNIQPQMVQPTITQPQPQQLVQTNPYLYYPQIQPNYIPGNMQQMPYNPNQQNIQTVQSDRVWSQGENAAKAYLVSKNTEQVIWDSEQPVIYIKTVDSYGRPSMVILDYTIRQQAETNSGVANNDVSNLHNEMNDIKNEMNELRNDLKQFMQNSNQRYSQKYNKKEVANNES